MHLKIIFIFKSYFALNTCVRVSHSSRDSNCNLYHLSHTLQGKTYLIMFLFLYKTVNHLSLQNIFHISNKAVIFISQVQNACLLYGSKDNISCKSFSTQNTRMTSRESFSFALLDLNCLHIIWRTQYMQKIIC